VWTESGHISEVGIVAIADAQTDIVPEEAVQHIAQCKECAMQAGHATLMSEYARELLTACHAAAAHAPSPIRAAEGTPVSASAHASEHKQAQHSALAGPEALPRLSLAPAATALGFGYVIFAHYTSIAAQRDVVRTCISLGRALRIVVMQLLTFAHHMHSPQYVTQVCVFSMVLMVTSAALVQSTFRHTLSKKAPL